MEDPDISPHTYGYLIFDKEIRTAPWKRQHLQPIVLVTLHGYVQKSPRKVSSRHNRTSSPRLAAHIKPTQVQARRVPALTGVSGYLPRRYLQQTPIGKGKSVFSPGTSLGQFKLQGGRQAQEQFCFVLAFFVLLVFVFFVLYKFASV